MSNLDIRAIAQAGYVRACFSKRLKGHALPLELVRRHLGAVNESGFRRRLRREFSGYLVTDNGPEIVPVVADSGRAAGVWRDRAGRVVVLGERWTGEAVTRGFRGCFEDVWGGGCIDAAVWLPAGGCESYKLIDEFCSAVIYAARAGVFE